MAIDRWFAGYRHGAALAQESGYRQLVQVPASAPAARGIPDSSSRVGRGQDFSGSGLGTLGGWDGGAGALPPEAQAPPPRPVSP
jgi:hypothetical protein